MFVLTLMCMSCMFHNFHDLCLNMCIFLCGLHELYHFDVFITLACFGLPLYFSMLRLISISR